MNKEQASVQEFMLAFGQECPDRPCIPPEDTCNFRVDFIDEENAELDSAFKERNVTLVADALADILYVTYGTAIACGLDMERIFAEVHRSNMSKFWNSMEVASRFNRDAQELYQQNDGDIVFKVDDLIAKKIGKNRWIVKNTNHKVIKSPSYSPADISSKLVI